MGKRNVLKTAAALVLSLLLPVLCGCEAAKYAVPIADALYSAVSGGGASSGHDAAYAPVAEGSDFSIHFIDVGQADAALVSCDGHHMLIDGGNRGDSNTIYAVLKRNGITHLDMVVGTHAHEDHIGGLPGAFNYATAGMTLSPVTEYESGVFEDFAKYAKEKGGGLTVPEVGDEYGLGSALVTILGVNSGDDTNDTSIVLRIDYGGTSFLFTGDAEVPAEEVILNSGADVSATLLKVGHHGSDTSTSYPFLREVMSKYAVISVGEDNSYGHPAKEVLSRLSDADVEVYRTDLLGDIFVTSDGSKLTITNAAGGILGEGGDDAVSLPGLENEDAVVWVTSSGEKYHTREDCSGITDPEETTLTEAEDKGYEPCQRCD